jgi:hypothetical protein
MATGIGYSPALSPKVETSGPEAGVVIEFAPGQDGALRTLRKFIEHYCVAKLEETVGRSPRAVDKVLHLCGYYEEVGRENDAIQLLRRAVEANADSLALCERLGHVAYVDPNTQMVVRRTQLAGLIAGPRRVAFSPEGRLAVVPETGEGCLALIDTGAAPAGPGELMDRLELGREVGEILWSPFGDELFVTSPECASLLKIGVDRGDQDIKDTDVYLMEMLLRREDPAGHKYPLFPP